MVGQLPQRPRQPLGHTGGLVGTGEEPGDRARGDSRPTAAGEVDGLPSLGGQIIEHPRDVVFRCGMQSVPEDKSTWNALSTANFCGGLQYIPTPNDHHDPMADRPVFHPDIGKFLADRREEKGWTQRQAIDIAQRRGIALGLGPLRFLELGRTKYPDADLLRAVAKLYGLSFDKLAQRFAEANYGVLFDLPGHGSDQESRRPLDGGTLDDPIAIGVELRTLREQVKQYEKEASEVRTVTDSLVRSVLALEKIKPTTERKPSRRRRDRKVG